MSQHELKTPVYDDGRTKQAFKDETDINKILQRAQKTGTISHLAKHEGHYGDFSNYDFLGNQIMLARGREVFDDLPAELRREFNQSPQQFFQYVNDPANKDDLGRLLPALAEPGRQNLNASGVVPADLDKEPLADPQPTPEPKASEPAKEPEKAPEGASTDVT